MPDLLETKKNGKPTVSVVPNGYLLLFDKEQADEQYEALKNHSSCDAETKNIKAEDITKKQIKELVVKPKKLKTW